MYIVFRISRGKKEGREQERRRRSSGHPAGFVQEPHRRTRLGKFLPGSFSFYFLSGTNLFTLRLDIFGQKFTRANVPSAVHELLLKKKKKKGRILPSIRRANRFKERPLLWGKNPQSALSCQGSVCMPARYERRCTTSHVSDCHLVKVNCRGVQPWESRSSSLLCLWRWRRLGIPVCSCRSSAPGTDPPSPVCKKVCFRFTITLWFFQLLRKCDRQKVYIHTRTHSHIFVTCGDFTFTSINLYSLTLTLTFT